MPRKICIRALAVFVSMIVLAAITASAHDLTDQSSTPVRYLASWYGANHQGHPTANGEKFDRQKLTAAHRSLPFGTIVRVTNLINGKQVLVRINDRGPYHRGRALDLSEAAARRLGMLRDGLIGPH